MADKKLKGKRVAIIIPAFNSKMIEQFAEGVHRGQRAKVGAV